MGFDLRSCHLSIEIPTDQVGLGLVKQPIIYLYSTVVSRFWVPLFTNACVPESIPYEYLEWIVLRLTGDFIGLSTLLFSSFKTVFSVFAILVIFMNRLEAFMLFQYFWKFVGSFDNCNLVSLSQWAPKLLLFLDLDFSTKSSPSRKIRELLSFVSKLSINSYILNLSLESIIKMVFKSS